MGRKPLRRHYLCMPPSVRGDVDKIIRRCACCSHYDGVVEGWSASSVILAVPLCFCNQATCWSETHKHVFPRRRAFPCFLSRAWLSRLCKALRYNGMRSLIVGYEISRLLSLTRYSLNIFSGIRKLKYANRFKKWKYYPNTPLFSTQINNILWLNTKADFIGRKKRLS